jgi:uncharacterized protein YkwD
MQLPPFETKILELINAHRQTLRLPALLPHKEIVRSAAVHTANMATGKSAIGHEGFEGRAADLITGLDAITAAENVAYGQTSPEEVVKNWLDSAGHRQNIEGNYNLTGIATQTDAEGRNVFTQIFVAVPTNIAALMTVPTDDELSLEILNEINAHRQNIDLQQLLLDENIQAVALSHSRRMASGAIPLGYDGLKEQLTTLAQNLRARSVAANIAQSKPHADKIIETWLASAAHCKNIEGNYNRTGVGVAHNERGEYFITQLFLFA